VPEGLAIREDRRGHPTMSTSVPSLRVRRITACVRSSPARLLAEAACPGPELRGGPATSSASLRPPPRLSIHGWREYLLVQWPTALLAGAAGVWLFYVQHQFEDTYWQSSNDWSYADAALRGSSYLRLPKLLQFFTGNIGLHHVHHLSTRIPNYNLQRAHDENPIFHDVPTLSLWDGLRAVRLKLWDEDGGRLVTFGEAGRRGRSPSTLWPTATTSSSPIR
jgi:hypothetical protein